MSEKALWGLWSDGKGWVRDAQGFPMVYHDPRIAGDCRDAIQEQRLHETIVVCEVTVSPVEKTLWGLWAGGGSEGGRWYLDYFGRPCFSYDRRLVAAHANARKSSEPWVFSVREVGDDGYPIEPVTGEVELQKLFGGGDTDDMLAEATT